MKKSYTRPAIVSEDVLEQTSLACNSTAAYSPNGDSGTYAPGTTDGGCRINVAKGNNYADDSACQTILQSEADVVVLS